MGAFERLESLIASVYEVALCEPESTSERLGTFLETCSKQFACRSPGIGLGGSQPGWLIFALTEEAHIRSYDEHFAVDLASVAVDQRLVGSAFEIERLAPGRKSKWAFFADWMAPQTFLDGIGFYTLLDDQSLLGFAAYRERAQPDFDGDDLRVLSALMPHIRRSVELNRRLGLQPVVSRSTGSVLERLAVGVVLLDERGGLLFANDVAERLARRADGFDLSSAGLRLRRSADRRRFESLFRGAARPTDSRTDTSGGALLVRGGDSAGAFELVVSPAPSTVPALGLRRVAVLVLIHDPTEAPAPDEEVLRDLYGLTGAEARVASRLASGRTVDEIASEAGVRTQTVRNQLKAVFEKTSTHRQAELTHLLRAGLATTAPPGRSTR